ncbi:MAG: nicotinate (nicotinamide) nucleotide adenylyltransferase [Fusobacteriaceae bacterium]|jgi:nicotinate-nucleotide adenylyltransferase|nr:nicotinate (nicotinamide) nucleotide adenylyltransferase [Fusobacteriaceae bacterium]
MNIGIYGGLFDPVHLGHEAVVSWVMPRYALQKLFVVPVGVPSHRAEGAASAEDRLAMCRLAFAGMPDVIVSDMEVRDPEPAYTYDTLRNFRKLCGEAHQYYEIIGEDSLAYFDQWKNYRGILALSRVIVLKRAGYRGLLRHENILQADSPDFPLSSTEVRAAIREGRDIGQMVSPEVAAYIGQYGLYK